MIRASPPEGTAHVDLLPSRTEFFFKVVDAQITFVRDAQGAVTGLVLHQNATILPPDASVSGNPYHSRRRTFDAKLLFSRPAGRWHAAVITTPPHNGRNPGRHVEFTTANGAAPFTITTTPAKVELLSSSVVVLSTGAFTGTENIRTTVNGTATPSTLPFAGTLSVSGTLVTVTITGSAAVLGTLISSTQFSFPDPTTGATFVFVKQ